MTQFLSMVKSTYTFEDSEKNEWILTPIGLQEIGEFILWWKFKPLEEAKFGAEHLPPEIREKLLLEKYKECQEKELSFESEEIRNAISSINGFPKLFHLSLRVRHPELKFSEISRIINIHELRGHIAQFIEIILGFPPEDGESKSGEVSKDQSNQ